MCYRDKSTLINLILAAFSWSRKECGKLLRQWTQLLGKSWGRMGNRKLKEKTNTPSQIPTQLLSLANGLGCRPIKLTAQILRLVISQTLRMRPWHPLHSAPWTSYKKLQKGQQEHLSQDIPLGNQLYLNTWHFHLPIDRAALFKYSNCTWPWFAAEQVGCKTQLSLQGKKGALMYPLTISKPALHRQKVSWWISEVINKVTIQQINPGLHEAHSTTSRKMSISFTADWTVLRF